MVLLGRAELFGDGWQPMLAAARAGRIVVVQQVSVERRGTLRLGLAALSGGERRVIALRFVGDVTQQ
jgi:hypothetical protein